MDEKTGLREVFIWNLKLVKPMNLKLILKILPEYFEAVVSGDKRFEIRKNDRNYQNGDILRLNEYQDGQYTGDVHVAEITYITDYAQQDGYVVLGIK